MSLQKYNYLFISDLHVAMGVDQELGAPHPREDFFFDDEFRRFLEWADRNRVNSLPWELVLVGDCFDFLPVTLELMQLENVGWSELSGFELPFNQEYVDFERLEQEVQAEKDMLWLRESVSISRLTLIEKGHQRFFGALGWWVGQGHRLVILRGNHDYELYWDKLQEVLKYLIWNAYNSTKVESEDLVETIDYPAVDDPDFKSRIILDYPWFYYEPGLFYAEHGSQYEVACASVNVIDPSVTYDSTRMLIPDFGALVVKYLVAPMEDDNPTWDNRSTPAAFLSKYARQEPQKLLGYLFNRGGIRDGWRMGSHIWELINLHSDDLKLSEDDLIQYGAKFNLPLEVVEEISKVRSKPPLLSNHRLAWLLFSPGGRVIMLLLIAVLAFVLIAGVLAYFFWLAPIITVGLANLLVRLFPNLFSPIIDANAGAATLIIWVLSIVGIYHWKDSILRFFSNLIFKAIAAVISREGMKAIVGEEFDIEDYLYNATIKIHRVFRNHFGYENEKVPLYYIMGHDHHPAARRIANTGEVYFNTGTWLPKFGDVETRHLRTGGEDSEFTFLQLMRKGAMENPEARLLRWNDGVGMPTQQIVDPLLHETVKN